ncbi:MAG: helix-turn-helix domain-containing protein [Ruminococcus sp.]|nr:helix-turn-helix domain-containing protein [Ruminococcus sp.]
MISLRKKLLFGKDLIFTMTIETANKLLTLRKQHNLSQEGLAEKLGISRQAVSKWERGEASPDTDNLIQLAKLYNISLDELLNVDIKLYNKNTISLTKPEDKSAHEDTYSQSTSTYKHNEFNSNSYMAVISEPQITPQGVTTAYTSKTVTNPFSFLDTLADALENFMYRHGMSYRWLYLFPCYAIATGLFFIFGYLIGFDISWGWFLTIPLYYTTIKCLEKRNLYIFCYPVVALIMFFTHGYLIGFNLSWLWFLTIPLYYTLITALKKKNPMIFCYPVVAVILFIIFGYLISYKLSLMFFATIPFYYWYFSKKD